VKSSSPPTSRGISVAKQSEPGKQHQTSIGSIGVGGDGQDQNNYSQANPSREFTVLGEKNSFRERSSFVTSDAALEKVRTNFVLDQFE